MKYRSSFVSNSSSSSYIVAYLPHEPSECPHCHQQIKDLLDRLEDFEHMESYHGESTQIIFHSLDQLIENEHELIIYNRNQINEVKHLKDDDVVSQYANAGQIRKWSNETITESTTFISKLMDFHNANPNHKFIKFQVNYNNTELRNYIDNCDDIEIFAEYGWSV